MAAIGLGLFGEAQHLVALQLENAEAAGRQHGRDGGELAVLLVEVNRRADVDVGNAVAIGQAEGFLVCNPVDHALQAPAGHRRLAGVNQGDAPVFSFVAVSDHLGIRHIEGYVRHVQRVVREELLDHVALVAEADDEIIDAMSTVHLHDMPQNRPSADFNQRLGAADSLFAEARAEAAGEDDGFHKCNAPLVGECLGKYG